MQLPDKRVNEQFIKTLKRRTAVPSLVIAGSCDAGKGWLFLHLSLLGALSVDLHTCHQPQPSTRIDSGLGEPQRLLYRLGKLLLLLHILPTYH